MKEQEHESKTANPVSKVIPPASRPQTLEQLRALTTDELVRMLMRPEMAMPANAELRKRIIMILQDREGNAFVQRLLGKSRLASKSPSL